MKKILFSFLFFIITFLGFSQNRQLSNNAEISIITIGPGQSLVDNFGHSALRVFDKSQNFDVIYNYGVYDFDNTFILKFARGKLNYRLKLENSSSHFFKYYAVQNRTIKEQVLNLDLIQKQKLYDFLVENEKPENRYYLYDFFYDNCASILRDIINEEIDDKVVFNLPDDFEQKTFRRLIHSKINQNTWGSLGIDVALGSVIDIYATPEEHMFLPDFVHDFFGKATYKISGKNLVKSERLIFEARDLRKKENFITSPLLIFSIVGLLIFFITYNDYKKQTRSRWLDVFLFALTGLIGVFILLLWFATDHTATAQNYNLLWAFVINLFVIGQVLKKRFSNWFIKYLKFLVIALCLFTLHWVIGVQVFAIGIIPLLIALLIRYLFLIRYFKSLQV